MRQPALFDGYQSNEETEKVTNFTEEIMKDNNNNNQANTEIESTSLPYVYKFLSWFADS